jgi:hypothetical protein
MCLRWLQFECTSVKLDPQATGTLASREREVHRAMKLLRGAVLLVLLGLKLGASPGTVFYGNLSAGSQDVVLVAVDGPLYASFSTGGTLLSLSDVQLKLNNGTALVGRAFPRQSPILLDADYWKPIASLHPKGTSKSRPQVNVATGTLTVALYADNSSSPGALLTTIGTLDNPALGPVPADHDFPLSTPYPLAANTRYWIGLSATPSSDAAWVVSSDTAGTGITTEFWDADGMVHSNADPPFQMQVVGAVITAPPAAPAPASLLLALVGFAGAALYLNRKRLGFSR